MTSYGTWIPAITTMYAIIGLIACKTPSTKTTGTTSGVAGRGGTNQRLFGSGSRLRARYFTDGKGAEIFAGLHDTTLDVDCVSAQTKDGLAHCLPVGATANGTFEDAACTVPLAQYGVNDTNVGMPMSPLPIPVYARALVVASPGTPTCDATDASVSFRTTGSTYWKSTLLGKKIVPSAVYSMNGGTCAPTSIAPWNTDYYELGADVPDSMLAPGKEVDEMVGPRAVVTVFRGDDGSFYPLSFLDGKLGYACPSDSGDRCLSRSYAAAYPDGVPSSFADAACTQPVAIQRYGCNPPDYIVEPAPPSGCNADLYTYFQVGAMLGTLDVYDEVTPGTCQPWAWSNPNDTEHTFFVIGAQLPSDYFLLVGQVEQGSERLKARAMGLRTGERIMAFGSFTDSEFPGEACYAARFPDGHIRCVPEYSAQPSNTLPSGVFSDSSCSAPLGHQPTINICKTNEVAPYAVIRATPDAEALGAGVLPHIQEIRAATPYTGTPFKRGGFGSCSVASNTGVYTLGDPVDPSRFAELQLVRE